MSDSQLSVHTPTHTPHAPTHTVLRIILHTVGSMTNQLNTEAHENILTVLHNTFNPCLPNSTGGFQVRNGALRLGLTYSRPASGGWGRTSIAIRPTTLVHGSPHNAPLVS